MYVCVPLSTFLLSFFRLFLSQVQSIRKTEQKQEQAAEICCCVPLFPPFSKLSGRRLNFLKTGNENKKWKKRTLSHAIYYRITVFSKKKCREDKIISCSFLFIPFFFSVCSSLLYIMCDVSDIQYYIYQPPCMKKKKHKKKIQMEIDTHIPIIYTRIKQLCKINTHTHTHPQVYNQNMRWP